MALNGRIRLILQLSLLTLAAAEALPQLALPNCPTQCGNLTNIPYPFGIGDGCYLPQGPKEFPFFGIVCTDSTEPPQAIWAASEDILVTNISLQDSELQIMQYVARDCYNEQGVNTVHYGYSLWSPFVISNTKNKFIAVGCDTNAFVEGYRGEERYVTGCSSYCKSLTGVNDSSCSGVGCCQTSIPSGLNNQTVYLGSFDNHTGGIWDFNPCSYAFIVQEGYFTFSTKILKELESIDKLPMLLDWAIGNDSTCDAAQKKDDFACKANSKCVDPPNRNGYICQCLKGYQGNPYLPQGCQDVDECGNDPCDAGSTCQNERGSYSCICNKGYKKNKGYTEDGKNGTRCIKKNNNILLVISLVVSVGLLVLLVGISWIYWGLKKRKFMKLKQKYFKENGGLLLKQQLASRGGSVETTKIFAAEELEKATNNYHESRVLGEGGYGTVYKGILTDNKVVAIKKSKIGAPAQNDQFVNEVILLSQINHRNVVRLLGCCLETEVPLLVYEFITHGTLSEHIHNQKGKGSSSLSWELRLKIASETAGALAYLHSSISIPIIHRDVKVTNILLDENFTAKVSDFGASRLIPADQNELSTLVQGTLGYLDPEYLQSNTLTEKSDVYSFGVVLVELLTRQVALSFDRPEAERNLANFFVHSIEKDRLIQILDEDIVNERNIETIEQVASVAKRCLKVKGEERPGMKEVAMELEGIRITANHPWGGHAVFCGEEAEHLLGSSNSDACVVNVGGDGGTTRGYDSMQIQQLMPYDDGR